MRSLPKVFASCCLEQGRSRFAVQVHGSSFAGLGFRFLTSVHPLLHVHRVHRASLSTPRYPSDKAISDSLDQKNNHAEPEAEKSAPLCRVLC